MVKRFCSESLERREPSDHRYQEARRGPLKHKLRRLTGIFLEWSAVVRAKLA